MAMTLDGTNGVFLPTWTTATRPASPSNGEIGYNSTTGALDQYVGGAWASVPTSSASAGGSNTQLQYNNSGSFGGISQATTDGTRVTFSTTIGVGGATPSTSGSGISFPATQSASTNVNTLDDYEEGSWTPTIGGNATYSTQRGGYVKVGRVVFIQMQIVVSTKGTGSATTISGLPFSVSNPSGNADAYSAGALTLLSNGNISVYSITCQPQANTSTIEFNAITGFGGATANSVSIIGDSTHIQCSAFYYTST